MTIPYCYNSEAKKKYASELKSKLRRVAKTMGLVAGEYDLRFNPGGIAVWGEVTLHTDSLYIQASHSCDLGVLVRTCKGRKDYTGGPNKWVPVDLLNKPEEFVEAVKRVTVKFQEVA